MHTLIVLRGGVLTTWIVSDHDADISSDRWRAAIAPAISLLQHLDMDSLCVVHDESELEP